VAGDLDQAHGAEFLQRMDAPATGETEVVDYSGVNAKNSGIMSDW
jgi:hypothetical protein